MRNNLITIFLLLVLSGGIQNCLAQVSQAELNTGLIEAVINVDSSKVKELIEKGADVNYMDQKGFTALHYCAGNGYKGLAILLIESGADINAKDGSNSITAISLALKYSHTNVLNILLDNDPDITITNKDGGSYLLFAIYYKNNEVAKSLISMGIDINKADNDGYTPFHYCAMTGNIEIAELLLSKGVIINKSDNVSNQTAKAIALEMKNDNFIKLLSKNSLNNLSDDEEQLFTAVKENDLTKVNNLLLKGVNVNVESVNGEATPLHFACSQNNSEEVAQLLLENGATVNSIEIHGYTPLHFAVVNENDKTIELLIKHGANINIQDLNGYTPLMMAVKDNHLNIVKILSIFNPDKSLKNHEGKDVYTIANEIADYYTGIANNFHPAEQGINSKIRVLLNENIDYVFEKLDFGFDELVINEIMNNDSVIYKKNKEGQTLLHKAIYTNSIEVIDLLIEKGINIDEKDNLGRTPLYYSIFLENIHITKQLLKAGSDVNIENNNKETALSIAHRRKYKDLLSLLMLEGAVLGNKVNEPEPELIIPYAHKVFVITSVDFSNDGKYFLSSSRDETLKLWETASGMEIRNIGRHSENIESSCLSHNDNFALSGSIDKTIKLWDIEAGLEMRTFTGHKDDVNSVCFSSDDKFILSGSSDHTLKMWDLETGKEIKTFRGHQGPINSVSYSPNGKYALSGSYDQTIKLWDIEKGIEIITFTGHEGSVESVCFSPDGKFALSGSDDNSIKLWNVASGENLRNFDGHTNWVNTVQFAPDGKYILSCADDKSIKLWDVNSGKEIRNFNGHSSRVNSISFSPNGKYFLSGSSDASIKLWDISHGIELKTIKGHTSWVNSINISNSGDNILFGSGIDDLKQWSLSTNEVKLFNGTKKDLTTKAISNKSNVKYVDLSTNDEFVITATNTSSDVSLWDLYANEEVKTLKMNSGDISCLKFSPDGKYAIFGTEEGGIELWDVLTGKYLKSFTGHSDFVLAANFSPDGKYIISGSYDNTIKLWDMATGKELKTFVGHTRFVKSVCFSSDSKHILSGSDDNLIKLWDVSTGKETFTLSGHTGRVYSVCFSPDGKSILSGSADKSIKLWETNSGTEISTFTGHTGGIETVKFTPEGKYAISNSADRTIKIWDLNNKIIAMTFVNLDSNNWLMVTPDNYYSSSKESFRFMGFKIGSNVFSMEQFDLKYNRPDIVLDRLGYASKELINIYYKAYKKRLQKLGFQENQFNNDFHIPKIEIVNKDQIEYATNEKHLELEIYALDSKYKLDRYYVWINDVPVLGMRGKSLNEFQTDSVSVYETLALSQGKNKIQVSCLNDKGVQSLKETIEITYEPEEIVIPDLHIISLSVSEYLDKSMNLKYAVKDGRDLASLLSNNKDFKNVYIDTLFNQNATKENIIKIKEKLLKSKVDDQVILFVSGHGLLDNNYDFYFATHDIDFDNPAERGISYDQLEWLLDSIPARKKLFMMDACHSGEVDKEELIAFNDLKEEKGLKKGIQSYTYRAKVLQGDKESGIGLQNSFELMQELFTNLNRGSGAVVISAAAGDSYALESDEWDNGVFTYSVLDGLKNGYADLNQDEEITVSELRNYVSKKVQEETGGRQKPTARQENVEFDFRVW